MTARAGRLPPKLAAQFENLRRHLPRAPMWAHHLPVAAQAKELPILELGGVLGVELTGDASTVLPWEDWLISLGWRQVSDDTISAVMGYGWPALQVAMFFGLHATVSRWARSQDLVLLPTANAALGGPFPPAAHLLSLPIVVALVRSVSHFGARYFVQGCQDAVRYGDLVGAEG